MKDIGYCPKGSLETRFFQFICTFRNWYFLPDRKGCPFHLGKWSIAGMCTASHLSGLQTVDRWCILILDTTICICQKNHLSHTDEVMRGEMLSRNPLVKIKIYTSLILYNKCLKCTIVKTSL